MSDCRDLGIPGSVCKLAGQSGVNVSPGPPSNKTIDCADLIGFRSSPSVSVPSTNECYAGQCPA
jgi:hypothetical protein